MIDYETDEILSRYLDGDLGDTESRKIAERLRQEPELQEALDDIRSLRKRLRNLALEERPPEVLDRLVGPLRRAGRPRNQRWAAVAMVAAAAVVVVGLIVVSEVGRTGWMPWRTGEGVEDGTIFKLSNLPSRDPDAPLGAIETLLAESDPEPELVQPEALEVMGPLNQPPGDQRWVLLIHDREIAIAVSENIEDADLWLSLRIEDGRVTSCRQLDEVETGPEIEGLCRESLSNVEIAMADGEYEAKVFLREE